ncbi:hypothetical protein K1719_045184 [Acacia pycnantha]|nr:hypothetical protein K1719_045184 [Acacia pycnantha]
MAPTIMLQFTALDLTQPMENSLVHSSSGSLACLARVAAPNNVNSVLNVIANYQQRNVRILLDIYSWLNMLCCNVKSRVNGINLGVGSRLIVSPQILLAISSLEEETAAGGGG